ncbi:MULTISPECIES: extensin-like domain-containing protein [unclassified Paracoccus (in: a-proteobacteria)]|uniref:extensin-like domain-containing protein n=1 Tax=unclassified Paracoccus (in: a-proteobacteria) TaxID=2688777 RepID=UPI001E44BA37|nr:MULTISPECIES: extensin family protein [unclassified Paracoccus (in: a-proteobacteria)]UXU75102.1 extensin family protein [Paracoccus sp. SMMA_5]UXU81005.1 extensin family protein [Paracoccus sp. SMMA_5_TC]
MAIALASATWAQEPPARPADPPRPPERPADAGAAPESPAAVPAVDQADRPGEPPAQAPAPEDDFTYSACLLELRLLGAVFHELPSVADSTHTQCGIARPIRLEQPLPGIELTGGAMMRCDTARELAHWLRDFVRPAAALRPGQSALVALEPGTGYQCRQTVGDDGGKLSEHALGNALDIAALRFEDGSRLEIKPRQDGGDMDAAFQQAIRATACLHFTTVLGPGSNAAHDDHLHLDIKSRQGGWRLCQ